MFYLPYFWALLDPVLGPHNIFKKLVERGLTKEEYMYGAYGTFHFAIIVSDGATDPLGAQI